MRSGSCRSTYQAAKRCRLQTWRRASLARHPHLVYHIGPLLTSVQVYTIFWGPRWAQQQPLIQRLNAFFDFILTSDLIDQLGEYSVPAYRIGHGRRIGSIVLPSPVPHISVTDSGVRHLLQQEIASNSQFPSSDAEHALFRVRAAGRARDSGRQQLVPGVLRATTTRSMARSSTR
jgi:hypothetical protein